MFRLAVAAWRLCHRRTAPSALPPIARTQGARRHTHATHVHRHEHTCSHVRPHGTEPHRAWKEPQQIPPLQTRGASLLEGGRGNLPVGQSYQWKKGGGEKEKKKKKKKREEMGRHLSIGPNQPKSNRAGLQAMGRADIPSRPFFPEPPS